MLRITLNETEPGFALPGLPDWLARLLYARGIRGEEAAREFLNPSWEQILPPERLPGIAQALAVLQKVKAQGGKAAVYGDYDVDGVCAGALLTEALEAWGLPAGTYLPDRHKEGYGLNLAAVEELARDYQVLVTVDCGITGVEEVRRARELGMAVIVTDHHQVGGCLPPADAVVSPLLGNYPCPFLCGAGVAWKLAMVLLGDGARSLLELAALATVADLVPLLGENRSMAALGLPMLAGTRRPGLRAMMRLAGIGRQLTSDAVAFQIAPRINACGRMDSALAALELVRTQDPARAEELAMGAEEMNRRRKEEEALVLAESEDQIAGMDLSRLRGVIALGEGWNSGVVGLAAGRIAEKYCCPAVVLSREGETCVGSARSAGPVDLYAALKECADLFLRFGGHKQAAGLTILAENVPAFRERFSAAVAKQTGDRPLIPEIRCDGELPLSRVTPETVKMLERLEPFGMGNPAPRFLCREARALSLRPVGAEGRHLKCTFRQGNDLRNGIYFGGGDAARTGAESYNLVMTPTLNEFQGRISAECRIFAMEMDPASLRFDEARAAEAYLADCGSDMELDQGAAQPLTAASLDAMLAAGQGTLLVCRTLDTALKLRAERPETDFALGAVRDRRAFNTILLYGGADGVCVPFRRVVLCDGDWESAAAWKSACPKAEIDCLPRTAGLARLLRAMRLTREELRACYAALRRGMPGDAADFARRTGFAAAQAAFALRVFLDIHLVERRDGGYFLPPMQRRDPAESPLFRRAWQKEGGNI